MVIISSNSDELFIHKVGLMFKLATVRFANLLNPEPDLRFRHQVRGDAGPEPLIKVWVWAQAEPEHLGSGKVWARAQAN